MKISFQSFSRNVFAQVIVQIFLILKGLLILPILSKTLGSYYYGLWTQIVITITLLSTVLTLRFDIAFVRFFSSEQNTKKLKEAFSSMLLAIILVLCMVSAIFLLIPDKIAIILFDTSELTIFVLILAALLVTRTIFLFTLAYFRSKNRIIFYSVIQSFQILGEISILFIFIFLLRTTFIQALFFLVLFNLILTLFILFSVIYKIGLAFPKFNFLKPYLLYSLPLIPNVSLQWITNHSSRYFLTHYQNLENVGIYAASYSIAQIILFFVTPLAFVLYPTISKLWEENNIEEIKFWLSNSVKYYLLLAIPAVFGIHYFAPIILKKLATEEFVQNSLLVSVLSVGFLFLGIYQIYIYLFHLKQKTVWILFIFIGITLVNLILNVILISKIGISGAAFATAISYILQMLLVYQISFREFHIKLPYKFILKAVINSLIMYGILSFFQPYRIFFIIFFVILSAGIYFSGMFFMKGIGEKEIKTFRNMLPF